MIELHVDIPNDIRKRKKNTAESSDGHINEAESQADDSKPPGRTNERSSMLKLESLE
jgi:hypothetical protein